LVFYFDPLGRYSAGPLYMSTYLYVFIYAVYAGIDSFIHRKELGARKIRIIGWFLTVAGSCVAVQAIYPSLLMTGFGLALGVAILYLTINNPSGYEDNLTGALDNQYFGQWMQEQMNRNKKWKLLTVDLRELKRINKIFGAAAGDSLLQEVAEGLREITGSDYVFRLTGNRFLLLTRTLEGYERKRNLLQQFFEKGFYVNGELLQPEVVICGIRNSDLLKESDMLLVYIEYLASLAPRGEKTILIQSNENTMKGFLYEQEIERFLGTAIAEDLFDIYFQPVYSIRNKKYITLEALSRLRHPSLGPISPEVFISIAEKSGQITDLGYLQFCKICRFVKDHEEMMERIENIKINLSPMELLKEGHSQRLVQVLEEYGLPGSYFQVEVTETVATEYSESMNRAVVCFQKAGVGFCVDDFGAGYANLNTVMKFPFTVVKLDRSLLEGICEDAQKALFYQSIVSVLQNVGYHVVAEGVETAEQVERLSTWGVEMVQGYYFSPPVSAEAILDILKAM
ncbi:MAG: EAL domain-containing protein, partial [Lachnospiraceae bacterium]|nr:EAL domain-containing protein [Lachnospiraceae bacterium]